MAGCAGAAAGAPGAKPGCALPMQICAYRNLKNTNPQRPSMPQCHAAPHQQAGAVRQPGSGTVTYGAISTRTVLLHGNNQETNLQHKSGARQLTTGGWGASIFVRTICSPITMLQIIPNCSHGDKVLIPFKNGIPGTLSAQHCHFLNA